MSRPLSIAIRCESGVGRGLGHLIRMIGLANTLVENYGVNIRFLCDPSRVAGKFLADEGFAVEFKRQQLGEEEFIERGSQSAELLVLDKKWSCEESFIRSLRRSRRVVLIDHCGPAIFAADLTVFPCAELPFDVIDDPRWATARGFLLHGPPYVLINRKVGRLPRDGAARNGARKPIVLTTGGSDPRGAMLTVLPWLARAPIDREIHVLVGDAFLHRERLEKLRPQLPPHIRFFPYGEERLVNAELAVCTFGVTAYELMFLGIPSLVIGHSRENAESSRILEERCGATVDLGYLNHLSEEGFVSGLIDLHENPKLRCVLSRAGMRWIDGHGAERTAKRIVDLAVS